MALAINSNLIDRQTLEECTATERFGRFSTKVAADRAHTLSQSTEVREQTSSPGFSDSALTFWNSKCLVEEAIHTVLQTFKAMVGVALREQLMKVKIDRVADTVQGGTGIGQVDFSLEDVKMKVLLSSLCCQR